ncbi:MAG: leucine-rich repeat protein [Lachnospiraceae bacterium]|nr:leucine-rich repeat protein [Lachnospiraceae bacterium]
MKKRTGSFLAAVMSFVLTAAVFFPTTACADSTELYTFQVKGTFDTASARQMLDSVNDLRANDAWYWNSSDTEKITVSGLSPLVYDYELEQAAMQRAAELAVLYDHTRPNGGSSRSAYSDTFYYGYSGENIAYAHISYDADDIFTAWAEADDPYAGQGHRRNMLSSNFKAIGIGCFECDGMLFWTQEFSSKLSGAAAAPLTPPVSVEVLQDRIESVSLGRGAFNMSPGAAIGLDQIDFILYDAYAPGIAVPCVAPREALTVADPSVARLTDTALVAQSLGETTLTAAVAGMTAAAPIVVQEINSLTLDNPTEVTLAEGEELEFSFVSSETGYYVFSSSGSCDTIGCLYDSSHNLLESDDDSGGNYNFSLFSYLSAGTQYYYSVKMYSSSASGTFMVNLMKEEIEEENGFFYKLLSDGTAGIIDCSRSGDIVIPEQIGGYTVSNLAAELFYGRDDVTSVTIPKTVTYFGENQGNNDWDYVFSYCYGLKNIYVDSGNPTFKSVDGVLFSKDGRILINYPCAHPGAVYHVSADLLCCTSFAACDNLRFLFLDNSDTYWYTYTFYNTGRLTTFYKPGGESAQKAQTEVSAGREYSSSTRYCRLKSINEIQQLPGAVKDIQSEAFQNIAAKYLRFPDTCRSIGSRAFAGSGLEYVSVPKSAAIASDAFDSSVVIEKR